MEVGRVGGCSVQGEPGDHYASRWSADGIIRAAKNGLRKNGGTCASRWSAIKRAADTTKKHRGLTRGGLLMEVARHPTAAADWTLPDLW
jgi:hypothetical protein